MKELLFYLIWLSLMTICRLQDIKPPLVTFGIVEDYFTVVVHSRFNIYELTHKGYMNYVTIKCDEYLDPLPLKLPHYQLASTPLHIINIENCLLPTIPLEEVFANFQFNIEKIDRLILNKTGVPPNVKLSMNIKKLILVNVTNVGSDFFALKYLQKMTVEDMEMPQLPRLDWIHPNFLKLRNSPVKKWTNCEEIIELDMSGVTKDDIPEEWPMNCSLLRDLRMYSLPLDAVEKFATSVRHNNIVVRTIIMKNCSLVNLPITLMKSYNENLPVFMKLDFSDNYLEDEAFSQIPMMRQMYHLNLSNNRLKGGFIINVMSHIYENSKFSDFELYLDGNNITDLSSNYSIKSALVQIASLKLLSLNRMDLEPDCLMHTHSHKLERLNLQPRQPKVIEHLKLYGFPRTEVSKELTVDLRGISVKYVSIGASFSEDFDNVNPAKHWFNTSRKLIVLMDAVDCDCNNDVLARVLRKYPQYLSIPALKCIGGGKFLDEPMENLDCRKAIVNGCKRKISRRDNATIIDCSKNTDKFLWPKPSNFKGFIASGQNITTLKNAYLPESLKWLDLRNNNISVLDKADLAKLFLIPSRRIWLKGNPLRCDCDNAAFVKVLQSKANQIEDYEYLDCRKVSVFELCKTGKEHRRFVMSSRPVLRIEKSFYCPSQLEDKKTWDTEIAAHAINIYNCDLTPTPLAEVLKKLNISVTRLDTLHLSNITLHEPVPLNYTSELSIPNLKLTNSVLPENFFISLPNIRYNMKIENMKLPKIPTNLILEELFLYNATLKNWNNCMFIHELQINSMTKEQIPRAWPEKCARLKYLKLESLSTDTAIQVETSINDVVSLIALTVHDCGLTELPWKLMQNTERLETLKLSLNRFDDRIINQLPVLYNLKTLDLSGNRLTGEFLINLTEKVPALQALILDDNLFVHTFNNFDIKSSLTKLMYLERLSLNRMTLDPDCLVHSKFNSLNTLDIISNSSKLVELFKLYSLPTTSAKFFDLNLRGRPIRNVAVDRKFYESFNDVPTSELWLTAKSYKLNVHLDSVDCDCNNDELARALKDFPGFLAMPNLMCNQREYGLLQDQPMEVLNCIKATVHGCKRKMSRHFKYVSTVDCSNNAEKFLWPQPQGFHSFNASGNHIKTLHKAYLPDSLMMLDLSNNSISRLDNNDTAKLFTLPQRRIWFAHNPIACECDNRNMIIALQTNHSQIMDYDLVKCEGSNQLLRLVSVEELCRERGPEAAWASVSVLAVLSMIAGLLLRRYWSSLRMILYSHGCCLSCLSEEDLDVDRPYDAFLSFAHGDDEYVLEKLLPRLEGAPNYYRVCVHYRDWLIGDWIPAQIMRSVSASKRTIIVLSQNFVRSWWGVLEFRYAHANAMSEGRSRLLVLILDDVLSEDLTPELRSYLDLNTYLRCDDPWFWEKLQYAMPHYKGKNRPPPSVPNFRAPVVSYPSSEISMRLAIENANHSADNDQRSAQLNQASEDSILQPNSLLAVPIENEPTENSSMQDMIDWFSNSSSSSNQDVEETMPSLITVNDTSQPSEFAQSINHSAEDLEPTTEDKKMFDFIHENTKPDANKVETKTSSRKDNCEQSESNDLMSNHNADSRDLNPFLTLYAKEDNEPNQQTTNNCIDKCEFHSFELFQKKTPKSKSDETVT